MRLDEILHIRLDLSKARRNLGHGAIRRVERLQARHLPLFDSKIDNTGGCKIVSGRGFGRREEDARSRFRLDRRALTSPNHQARPPSSALLTEECREPANAARYPPRRAPANEP